MSKHNHFKKVSRSALTLALALGLVVPVANSGEAQASGGGGASQQQGPQLQKEKPKVAPVPAKDQPNRIVTNFNGNTKHEMAFNWYTTHHFKDAKVWVSEDPNFTNPKTFKAKSKKVKSKYVERDQNGNFIFKDVKKDDDGKPIKDKNGKEQSNGYFTDKNVSGPEWTSGDQQGEVNLTSQTEHTYKAHAKGLKPNQTYYYRVGSEDGPKSEVGHFKTSGKKGDPFKFVQYTDTQNAFWNEHARNEAQFGADTLQRAIQTAGQPDFALHTGDFVESAEVEDEWKDLYDQSRPSFMSQPLAAVSGNHDERPLDDDNDDKLLDRFNRHVNVPKGNNAMNGGSYYSFDYNGAHMVVANTNDNKKGKDNPDGKAIGKKQMEWIKNDIKQARKKGSKWVILNLHKPMYSKSYHALSDDDVKKVRKELTKEIDDLDVDLVLQGHDHVLARTKVLQHTDTKNSFVNAKTEDVKQVKGKDNVKYYDNPKGSVYVLPNTGGTKEYDSITDKSLKHIKKVRPELSWLKRKDLDHYNSLFALGCQPQKSDAFKDKHSNNRDSSSQNFSVYEVKDNKLKVKIYQLSGDMTKGEPRQTKLIDEFGIKKDK